MSEPTLLLDEKNTVGVIARSALVLRALGDAQTGLSLGQIAKRVGLARSTVQRLIAALELEGLVTTGTGAGQIALGLEFFRLAQRARPKILERLHPLMESLSRELGETVDLSIINRDQLLFVDQVIGAQRLLAVSHIGDSFPLYCTSIGKAYLSTLSTADVLKSIGDVYARRTQHTLTTLEALIPSLAEIRKTGIGTDLEEHSEGICALGVVIRDGAQLFGLSVPIPVQRFEGKRSRIAQALLDIKTQIGGTPAASL